MDLENRLIGASEVAEMLGVSHTYAYNVIKALNKELQEQGYLTVSGKVEGMYFLRRYFPSVKTNPPVAFQKDDQEHGTI